jgi:hypothetical protein
MEALRGIGYSAASAVADLIDNSLTAEAGNVWLSFEWQGTSSFIRLRDDGFGMTEDKLRSAMRHGSQHPQDDRPEFDLGRFGLGMKTASLSQCRRVTVATRRKGHGTAIRQWNLDHVEAVNEWEILLDVSAETMSRLVWLDDQEEGTIVLLEDLDRIVSGRGINHKAFSETVRKIEAHLAMIFHRLIAGPEKRCDIHFETGLNIRTISPWDPFLPASAATDRTPEQTIGRGQNAVRVRGYILPHRSHLTEAEWERAAGPDGWISHQGFFIYRNARLLVSGGWMHLGRPKRWARDEPHKLARIRIDLPNTADFEWDIDIRKSTARPPEAVRASLTEIADHVRHRARRVLVHRGEYGPRAAAPDLNRIWTPSPNGQGSAYRIDRKHPAIARVVDENPNLKPILEPIFSLIEDTVPIERIWLDVTENPEFEPAGGPTEPSGDVRILLLALYRDLVDGQSVSPEAARNHLTGVEPFNRFPDLVNSLPYDIDQ